MIILLLLLTCAAQVSLSAMEQSDEGNTGQSYVNLIEEKQLILQSTEADKQKKELQELIDVNNRTGIKDFFKKKIMDFDTFDPKAPHEHFTLLIYAMKTGNLESAQELSYMLWRTSQDIKNTLIQPFIYAAQSNDIKMLDNLMIPNSLSFNRTKKGCQFALEIACSMRHVDMVQKLIRSYWGWTDDPCAKGWFRDLVEYRHSEDFTQVIDIVLEHPDAVRNLTAIVDDRNKKPDVLPIYKKLLEQATTIKERK